MKLYPIFRGYYEDQHIIGIFSSKAIAEITSLQYNRKLIGNEKDEPSYMNAGEVYELNKKELSD